MNIDVSSVFPFGETQALRGFFLDHRFLHDATSSALSAQFGSGYGTFALGSSQAEEEWAVLMQAKQGPTPQALQDWLFFHKAMHDATFQLIGGVGTYPPDLSQVEFWKPDQFYDWMLVHQQVHDYEQSVLGVS